jgi:uncharacterized integral membrane protein
MGPIYLILALLFSLLIAFVAVANKDTVLVKYLFGQAEVSLIVLILGSAVVGALAMGLFSLFRGIRAALRFREERRMREELRLRVKKLEEENTLLEAELARLKRPAGTAASTPETEPPQTPGEPPEKTGQP